MQSSTYAQDQTTCCGRVKDAHSRPQAQESKQKTSLEKEQMKN
jgi:hypothetical protein